MLSLKPEFTEGSGVLSSSLASWEMGGAQL